MDSVIRPLRPVFIWFTSAWPSILSSTSSASWRDSGSSESVYDPKSNGFVPVDAANATKIAGDIELPDGGLAALQSFAPTGYFAVTVH